MDEKMMVKSCVTVSLVEQAAGGPFVFWNDLGAAVRKAASLGFDAVEVFAASAEAVPVEELESLVKETGLSVAAFGTGGGWVVNRWHLCHEDSEVRKRAIGFVREMMQVAAKFGAPAIIGSMQGRWGGEVERGRALEWLREGLEELSGHGKELGQPVLYEPLNRYETNLFNRAHEAIEFLSENSWGNVQVLADLFHMNIEESSIPDAIRTYGNQLGHLHFVDSNRRAAGLGHLDFGPVVEALDEVGFSGYASAEVLPWPDSEEAARQTMHAFRKWFRSET